jgi:hypothetical protein
MVCAFAQAAGVEAMRARGRSGMQQMWLGKSARKDVFLLRDSGSGGEWRGVEGSGDWRLEMERRLALGSWDHRVGF